jgi:hypothetical protein
MANFYLIVNVVKFVIDIKIETVVEIVKIGIKVVQLLKELLRHCPGTRLNDLPESRGRD